MAGKHVCAGKLIASKRVKSAMTRLYRKRTKPMSTPNALASPFCSLAKQGALYETAIKTCWKKYERRNRELAHLASNLLILLALLYDCWLICGENLTTLKTEGRG